MNIDAKAREIARVIYDETEWDNVMTVGVEHIAAALLSVRSEALEEAAKVAEAEQDKIAAPRSYEMAHVCIGLQMAATAIRDLKDDAAT